MLEESRNYSDPYWYVRTTQKYNGYDASGSLALLMCRTSIFGKWQLASDFLIDGPLPPSLHLICAPPRLLSVRKFVVLLHGSTSWDIFRGTSMSTATTQPRMHITRTLSLMPQSLRSLRSALGSHLRALLLFSRTTPAITGRRRRKLG